MLRRAGDWLERIDPGGHRRIKGLRLVTAFGIAGMLEAMADIERGLPDATSLAALAGGFALWASVSEGRATRAESSRDLVLLAVAAALGAAGFALIVTLAVGGEHSVSLRAARDWETLIGDGLGLAAALLLPIGGAASWPRELGPWWRIRRRDR